MNFSVFQQISAIWLGKNRTNVLSKTDSFTGSDFTIRFLRGEMKADLKYLTNESFYN